MTKAALRKLYLQKRHELSAAAYHQYNRQVCENFFALVDLSFVKVLHTFLPIEARREPDTWLLVDRIRREFPRVRISLPRMRDDGELESIFFEGLHQLSPNAWGIPEPKQGVPTIPQKIDMVLVPMLACDWQGNRVGYGTGFYDRFLTACRRDCKRMGLSLFEPVDVIDDVMPFDMPLHACITPQGMIEFPQK